MSHDMPNSWHDQAVDKIVARLATDATRGLSTREAAQRLAQDGPNELRQGETVSPLALLAGQFSSLVIWVLIGAAVVSGILGETIDGVAIIAIVLLNALVGFFQEYRAERAAPPPAPPRNHQITQITQSLNPINPLSTADTPYEEGAGLTEADHDANVEGHEPRDGGIEGAGSSRPVDAILLSTSKRKGITSRKRWTCIGGVHQTRQLLDRRKPPPFTASNL